MTIWSTGAENSASPPLSSSADRYAPMRLVTVWVPTIYVDSSGVDAVGFMQWLNKCIHERGLVLSDGQILTTVVDAGATIDVTFEAESIDSGMPIPSRRTWGQHQADYFGLRNPYQMGEGGETYSWSHVQVGIGGAYLREQELILGLLHGSTEGSDFTCPCHYATIVYTSENRLVCMSCGATRVVLQEPLELSGQALTERDWVELFEDEDGPRADEDIDLAIVDFVSIENEPSIWSTNQWIGP